MLPFIMMSIESLNYYDILEVAASADQDVIYNAYQEAQKTYSLTNPDIYKIFNQKEAQDWVELIEEAYSVVGFPNSRRKYDQELNSQKAALPSLELEKQKKSIKPEQEKAVEQELPPGYGSTKISQYKITASMEELIEKNELFDGLFLKKVREYKNIDLTEFSKLTCIAIRHLYAIENNNFSVLPAAVFVRGYIVQYCRVLSLDKDKVVASFMSLLQNDN